MNPDNPLDTWLLRSLYKPSAAMKAQSAALVRDGLDALAEWLDANPTLRRGEMPLRAFSFWLNATPAPPKEAPRVKKLYQRVCEIDGPSKKQTEEALLNMIALAQDPADIPFWVGLLDIRQARDTFAKKRNELALAALALLAIRAEDQSAFAALQDATSHANQYVRELAVYYLGRACLRQDLQEDENLEQIGDQDADDDDSSWMNLDSLFIEEVNIIDTDEADELIEEEGKEEEGEEEEEEGEEEEGEKEPPKPLPPGIAALFTKIAATDKAFAPRFLARQALRGAAHPVPLDNANGAYAFKIKYKRDKGLYRTIELRSKQTLEQLHHAIQRSLQWDGDHLYSFFMNGRRWDERYQFSSPWEDDAPFWADEARIGQLGLTLRHKFLYLFDYGDEHEFDIEVVAIHPQAAPGKYPRVVDSAGKAPKQYWMEEYMQDDSEE